MKTKYIVGFMFDEKKELVVLIEKQKPRWQAGYLNGVGGKVEDTDFDTTFAMSREFREETGVDTPTDKWRYFAKMEGNDWIVDCFTQTNSDVVSKVTTTTNEKVCVVRVSNITCVKPISNIPWLVQMALDENMGNPPFYATIQYGDNR